MSCGLAGIEAQPGTRFKLVVKVAKLRPVSRQGSTCVVGHAGALLWMDLPVCHLTQSSCHPFNLNDCCVHYGNSALDVAIVSFSP
jgi:hypothetical protein